METKLQNRDGTSSEVSYARLVTMIEEKPANSNMSPAEAGDRIDLLNKRMLVQNPTMSYSEGMKTVLAENPNLKRAYGRVRFNG